MKAALTLDLTPRLVRALCRYFGHRGLPSQERLTHWLVGLLTADLEHVLADYELHLETQRKRRRQLTLPNVEEAPKATPRKSCQLRRPRRPVTS